MRKPNRKQNQLRQRQQSSPVEQELTRLDRELMDAARKDKTVMERTALDRYVFVNPGAGVDERRTYARVC